MLRVVVYLCAVPTLSGSSLVMVKPFVHLPSDPFPPRLAKLQGAERLDRLRVGDYRVVYEVDVDARHILVHYVRNRRDVYRRIL